MKQPSLPSGKISGERVMRMNIGDLQQIHRELLGKPSSIVHVHYLRRKVVWELQALACGGGLPAAARQHALDMAWQSIFRQRAHSGSSRPASSTMSFGHDTRLPPPGTLLRRQFKGRSILVKVLAAGFEYEGRIFGSLSSIANEVTGGNWNGFVFFGLLKSGHGRR